MRRFKKILPPEFVRHLADLDSDSLVIDIGANVGLVSEILARTGATVIAFEPNEDALVKLNEIGKRFPKLDIKPVAAGIKNDQVKLFLHKDSQVTNADLTQSSSLKESKPNVSADLVQRINEIDFAEFLKAIDKEIDLIKVDIEGYEVELVNHLLDENVLQNVGKVYIETHERKFTELQESTRLMKLRVDNEGLSNKFFFDWH